MNWQWQTVFVQNHFSCTMVLSLNINLTHAHTLQWPTQHLQYNSMISTCPPFLNYCKYIDVGYYSALNIIYYLSTFKSMTNTYFYIDNYGFNIQYVVLMIDWYKQ